MNMAQEVKGEFSKDSITFAQTVFSEAGHRHSLNKLESIFNLSVSPVALTAEAPSSSDLDSLLNNVGKASSATTITTVPDAPTNNDALLIQDVQTLESYIAVLTALVMYNKHPDPYDLSDSKQAAQFVIDTANAKNYVMTGGTVKDIVMYLPGMEASTETKSLSTTSADLHVDLLNALFGALSLPESVLTQLDGILTEISETLKSLKLSFSSQSQTLNHVVSFYYLSPVEGTSPPINEMKVRFLYLQIDQNSWKASAGKSSVEHFSFDMILTQTSSTMSSGIVSANTSNIVNSLMALTAKDPDEISKLTGAKGVKV
ncbi:hypothetical protein [Halomonas aestuarii]|nr:hypothetical protein [Halomonas aestuarii]